MTENTPQHINDNNRTQELKRLEKVKKRIKKKTPRFIRSDGWRFIKLKRSSWRRPVGIDNKMREKKGGWPKTVNIGYRTPRKLRGRHPSSLEEVFVNNPHDLELINPKTQAIRISGTVGRKKRHRIAETADIIGIHILNPEYAPAEAVDLREEILEEELEPSDLELDTLSADDLEFDEEEETEEEEQPLDEEEEEKSE